MTILQLVTRFQRRGAEVFAGQLSDELAGRGHDVVLVGLYAGAAATILPGRARAIDLAWRRRPLVSPRLLRRLMGELRRLEPDLVQANGSDTLKYASLARRRLGARWPLVYRNIGVSSRWLRYPGQRSWIRWLLGQVEVVASVSEASRRDFARTYGFPDTRIVTIPIGTECRDLAPRAERRGHLVREAGIENPGPLLLHVGSFTPEKNHRWLVETFAEIARRRPDARLILIGEGIRMPETRAVIERLGIGGRVRMLGGRADAAELVGGGDVLLLPSSTEGLPGVVLEAAVREVPAIAWDVGGVGEVIQDSRTGYVVPPGDGKAFIGRVLELIDDPELARGMGEAARAYACAEFDLPLVAGAFERLYQDLAR